MTNTTLNAPGRPPAPERVADIARRVLDLDGPEQVSHPSAPLTSARAGVVRAHPHKVPHRQPG
jgi:hypothetical protein